jgi:long-chain acyl-CoA synthetase
MVRVKTLQCLLDSLPRHGSRPALGVRVEYGARWWSYGDLYRNACRAASSFEQRGLEPGDRLILWSRNCPEWAGHFLGAALRGLVVVAVDPAMSAHQVAEIASKTEARLLLYGLEEQHRTVGLPKQSLFTLDLVPDAPASKLRVAINPTDPAIILFSSGTGSEPRGVVLSHENLICQVAAFARWREILDFVPVRLLALSPLSHVQGLMLGVCVPLSLGISVLYTHSAEPRHLIAAIRTHRIGILSTVPRVLELLEDEIVERYGRPSARLLRSALGIRFFLILVGGAPLPRARELFWRRLLCLIVQGYGSTETTAFATFNPPFTGAVGSIGWPIHPGSLQLAEDGEILVRGPHIALEYLAGHVTPQLTRNGYLHTGDLGARDAQDRIYFLGRKDDRIVTAEGHNIQPEIVETVLASCRGVRASVVVPRDSRGFKELHAVLLLEPAANAASVIREANRQLLPHERIRSWSVWPGEDFPRGTLGKIRRDAVVSLLAQADRAPTPQEEIPASIEDCLADPDRTRRMRKLARYLASTKTRPTQADIQILVRDWGLDSIDAVQLWSRLDFPTSGPRRPEDQSRDPENPDKSKIKPHLPLAPGWQWLPGVKWFRAFMRGLVLSPAIPFVGDVHVTGAENLNQVRPPFVVALDPEDREHALDYLIVYRALPRQLSRQLLFILGGGSPGLFDAYLSPSASDHWAYRQFSKFLFYIGVPMLFPYSLFPHRTLSGTMRGLNRIFAWIDRGYNPLIPWADGTALIAAQTQATVIPVRLSGNECLNQRSGWARRSISVTFGVPVQPRAGTSPNQLCRLVFKKLREAQPSLWL